MNHPAVQRWVLTAHINASITEKCKEMIIRGEANESLHKGLQPKAVMQEEAAVQSVIQVLDSWPNPFAKSKSLVSPQESSPVKVLLLIYCQHTRLDQ